MNSEILKVFRKFVFRERIETYKKLLIFGFFLIVSTVFWLIEALGKEYSTTIYYPVKYTNLPKDRILTDKLPEKFILRVKSTGYELLKYSLFNQYPLVFNYELFIRRSTKNNPSTKSIYLTRNLYDNITARLDADIHISEILPDTLLFKFSKIVNKNVPVKPFVKIKFDKQYTLKGHIKTTPENIYISGINSVIDTINFIRTDTKFIDNLNKNISFTIPVSKIAGVNYSSYSVNVKIEVEKFTESFIEVPIEVINLPYNIKFKIFPGKVTLNYFVGLSNFKKTNPEDFRIIVDYNSIKNNVGTKLKVKIVKAPDYISSIKINPAYINYSIRL